MKSLMPQTPAHSYWTSSRVRLELGSHQKNRKRHGLHSDQRQGVRSGFRPWRSTSRSICRVPESTRLPEAHRRTPGGAGGTEGRRTIPLVSLRSQLR
jgi:hypothetical protein